MLRRALMDAKSYRKFENMIEENLSKFGKNQVPLATFLHQNLKIMVIITKNNGFYVLACYSPHKNERIMIDPSLNCA